MKRTFQQLLWVLVLMLASSASLSAQSAQYYTTNFKSQPTDIVRYADLDEVYDAPSKGQGLYDAGRTLMIAGGMLMATGAGVLIYDRVTYEPSPDGIDEMNLTPLFVMFYGGAGASLALIGLPLFFAGKHISLQNNGSLLKVGVDSNGWGGIIKLGAGFSKSIAVGGDLIYGYHFNKYIFLGGGVGYEYNLNVGDPSVPLYVHSRFSLGNRSVAPYVGLSVGYDQFNNCEYYGSDVGVRIQKIRQPNRLVTWWISSDLEVLTKNNNEDIFWTFKIARSF